MLSKERHIFLCYSTKDRRFVDRLYSDLTTLGLPIWLDKIELRAGDSLPARIGDAISKAEFFVVVLSPDSMESKWVSQELELAIVRQTKEPGRLIIPILRKNCVLPPFLIPRLYIDFQDPKRYKESIQQLLRALDEAPEQSRMPEHLEAPTKKTSFAEDLEEALREANNAEEESDKWIETFQNLPLTQILTKAIRLGSFSGKIRRTVVLGLVMASQAGGGIYFNNILVLIGFLSDMEKRDIDSSYLGLLKEILENRSIEVTYRLLVLERFAKQLTGIESRRDRLALLPDIFKRNSFDLLADKLVNDFFSSPAKNNSGFYALWAEASPIYREDIINYVVRRGSLGVSIIEAKLALASDARALSRAFKKQWKGLRKKKKSRNTLEGLEVLYRLSSFLVTPSLDLHQLVSAIEEASAPSLTSDRSFFVKLHDSVSELLSSVRDRYGEGNSFRLAISLIASPYVDPALATLVLFFCIREFGMDSLEYDDNFPDCLLVQRDSGLSPSPVSIISALIEQIDTDPDNFSYFVTLRIIEAFPYTPLYAAIDMQIEDLSELSPKVSSLRLLLQGETTVGTLMASALAEK